VKPKLGAIQTHVVQHQGRPALLVRHPLGLSDKSLILSAELAPVLDLMDGTREVDEIAASMTVRVGVRLSPEAVVHLVGELDEALLLDTPRAEDARQAALDDFRRAPHRIAASAGTSYPGDPDELRIWLQEFVDALPPPEENAPPRRLLRGLVSPHIDYQRGGAVYAQAWREAAEAARRADLVVILGTDHAGDFGQITLTRQSYATPWGRLPTDQAVVDALEESMGKDDAFAEELHHLGEHSVELAAVWLHFVRAGEPVPMVPILCGSFAQYVAGDVDLDEQPHFEALIRVLRELMEARRMLLVAAADLAHQGPAFGDRQGLDFVGRARMRAADEQLIEAMAAGDAQGFFAQLKAEGDRRNVCGLPPIYLTLRALGQTQGWRAGYAICPADTQGTSFVSICGMVWE
jgi:AmmeMemoRadiSam system protein B